MSDNVQDAYYDGMRVRITREPYVLMFDDGEDTAAFWDGYYGRPLRRTSDRG